MIALLYLVKATPFRAKRIPTEYLDVIVRKENIPDRTEPYRSENNGSVVAIDYTGISSNTFALSPVEKIKDFVVLIF